MNSRLIIRAIAMAYLTMISNIVSVDCQELSAVVSVNMDQIPLDQRDNIATMQQDITAYLNSQRFTGADWEGPKIPIEVTVMLSGSNGTNYSSRLIFISKRNLEDNTTAIQLRVLDQSWIFPYFRNSTFSYQPTRFDPVATVLDFYVHLAIGLDLDSYNELDGSKHYSLARQMLQLGSASSTPGFDMNYTPGDMTRFSLITELLDGKFEVWRKLLLRYEVEGIELVRKDRALGCANIKKVLADMSTFKRDKVFFRSYLLTLFFDSHLMEIIDLFKGSNDRDLMKTMEFLDPSNAQRYQDGLQ